MSGAPVGLEHRFARPWRGLGDRLVARLGEAIGIRPVQVVEGLGRGEDRLAEPRDAVVVGGGLAGASAAIRLAERGFRVRVLERNRYLGGKLGAWSEALPGGESATVEHGFHGFFLQYYNLFGLLLDAGVSPADFPMVDDYAIVAADGREEGLRDYPRVPPFNVAAMAMRSPFLNMREARRMKNFSVMRDAFLAYDPERTFADWDGISFAELSERMGLGGTGFDAIFKVFGHSFFSESAEVSAAEIAKNFHFFFFANPEGLVFRYCRTDFEQAIWTPLRRRIEALGGRVDLGVEVASIDRRADGRWTIDMRPAPDAPNAVLAAGPPVAATTGPGETVDADVVVLATDPAGLRVVLEGSRALRAREASIEALVDRVPPPRPYAIVRLWTDRACDPRRAWFSSLHGHAPLDSVTLYHRMERESADWVARHGGSVLELHAYTPRLDDARRPEALAAALEERLVEAFPELRGMNVVHRVRQVRWDFPSFPPGSAAKRLRTEGPLPGLVFAGDWVRLDVPAALMEGAVTSGIAAANAVGRVHGLAPHPIWSVPPRGVLRRWIA